MILNKKFLVLLAKVYFVFGSVNVAYKILSTLRKALRARILWRNVPGKDADISGYTLMKVSHRLCDWVLSRAEPNKGEPLVKVDYYQPMLLCNTPESVQWMLKDQFQSITKPYETDIVLQMLHKFLGEEGIFVLKHGHLEPKSNKIWEGERKTTSLIFNRRNMKDLFRTTFVEKSKQAIKRLEQVKPEETIDMQELFFSFTMDSIEKIFMGVEVNSVTGGMSSYGKNFDKAHFHMMSFIFNNMYIEPLNRAVLPFPFGSLSADSRTLDTLFTKFISFFNKDMREFKKAVQDMDEHIYNYIEETKKDKNLKNRKDIIANFLNHPESYNLTEKQIRDIVINLTIAGRDTTACALSWLFFELTQNLDVQEKLINEIDTKLKGKEPELEDVNPEVMPYLNGCLYEALRLHPPVPLDTKMVSEDLEYLDGTPVPKGTCLLYSPYCMGRNSDVYPNPEKFDPERWIPFKEPSLFESPVFQAGPRFCLGKDMAKFEAKLLTCMLLQKFKFLMDENEAKNISYSMLITMSIVNDKEKKQNHLWIKPIPRKYK